MGVATDTWSRLDICDFSASDSSMSCDSNSSIVLFFYPPFVTVSVFMRFRRSLFFFCVESLTAIESSSGVGESTLSRSLIFLAFISY